MSTHQAITFHHRSGITQIMLQSKSPHSPSVNIIALGLTSTMGHRRPQLITLVHCGAVSVRWKLTMTGALPLKATQRHIPSVVPHAVPAPYNCLTF